MYEIKFSREQRKGVDAMNYFPLAPQQQEWKDRVAELAAREIGPRAAISSMVVA